MYFKIFGDMVDLTPCLRYDLVFFEKMGKSKPFYCAGSKFTVVKNETCGYACSQ